MSKLAIGIDIGGSKIAGVLLNERGKIVNKYLRPTEAYKSKEEILENILEVIHMLKKDTTCAIGIGVPGVSDGKGKLVFIPNVKNLQNINLRKEVEKRHRTKLFLGNDAKCFAIAENRLGAGRGTKNMMGIVIGTGVGSGIIIDGKIYLGASGGAGEIGHTKVITPHGWDEIEKVIAGPGFLKRYEQLSGKTAMSIAQLSKSNPHFKKTYHEFVSNTGVFFANLINTLNPEMIVVGGGVSNLDFYSDVRRQVRRHAVRKLADRCKIVKSKLGDYSCAIGAALMALEKT